MGPGEEQLLVLAGDRVAGSVHLAGLGNENGTIELRRIEVEEKGQGLGRAALELVLDRAFTALGARRLWLQVRVDNHCARHAFRAVGFLPEGLLRDALKTDEGYESLALMAILAPEWRARQRVLRGFKIDT